MQPDLRPTHDNSVKRGAFVRYVVAAAVLITMGLGLDSARGQEATSFAGRWQGSVLITKSDDGKDVGMSIAANMVCRQDGSALICISEGGRAFEGRIDGTMVTLSFKGPNVDLHLDGSMTKPGFVEGKATGRYLSDNIIIAQFWNGFEGTWKALRVGE